MLYYFLSWAKVWHGKNFKTRLQQGKQIMQQTQHIPNIVPIIICGHVLPQLKK
jgi:hypothetical protein